jgi:glucose/arabinose dehydrogenase
MEEIIKNWWVYPGFKIEVVASGFNLPVNIAFVPKLRNKPKDPLFYITELYGKVKVVTNDYTVYTYADDLLNYEPSHEFPGSGESGVTGICVEPDSGDLFLTMLYKAEDGSWKTKVVRAISNSKGMKMKKLATVIGDIPSTNWAHHAHAPTIGFDGKLYFTVGDGGVWEKAQDDFDLRGKVIRLNQNGTIPWDNPNPDTPVYAKGFRNPFGATWRKSDRSLYIADNGPDYGDRIAKVKPYENYGWPGSMFRNSIFWWHYTQAPTNLAFMQDGQFPPQFNDHLFVALFGEAYREGKGDKGKRIVKLVLNEDATAVKSYNDFVAYIGEGTASPCGLAFGPDGLYFTDLHGEKRTGGNVYKIVADPEKFKEFREKNDTYFKRWGKWGVRDQEN